MFYKILKVIFRFTFNLLFSPKVIGAENVPKEGAMIMAANHMSNWDPPILGTYLPRTVGYMAKEELFKPAIAGAIIKSLNAFPVKRGASDRGAIKMALNILKKGLCLGIFPEGTRSRDGKLHKAQAGVSLIAAMSKAPVVPTALIGTNKIWSKEEKFPQLTIVFGEPIYYEGKSNDKAALEEFSQEIMKKIENLIKLHSKC
ncbi:MAG: lysophospholipid acyltransferase family protein [Selenomonadaceae bacterium]|nr:1-acyl-sn-glycerol-3-phosphate acyltransferase [Selenomonadaceae bacterium]MDD6397738.1 lysophospholipid acyltransferase family protein [Selenomonadaceae bacterium]